MLRRIRKLNALTCFGSSLSSFQMSTFSSLSIQQALVPVPGRNIFKENLIWGKKQARLNCILSTKQAAATEKNYDPADDKMSNWQSLAKYESCFSFFFQMMATSLPPLIQTICGDRKHVFSNKQLPCKPQQCISEVQLILED